MTGNSQAETVLNGSGKAQDGTGDGNRAAHSQSQSSGFGLSGDSVLVEDERITSNPVAVIGNGTTLQLAGVINPKQFTNLWDKPFDPNPDEVQRNDPITQQSSIHENPGPQITAQAHLQSHEIQPVARTAQEIPQTQTSISSLRATPQPSAAPTQRDGPIIQEPSSLGISTPSPPLITAPDPKQASYRAPTASILYSPSPLSQDAFPPSRVSFIQRGPLLAARSPTPLPSSSQSSASPVSSTPTISHPPSSTISCMTGIERPQDASNPSDKKQESALTANNHGKEQSQMLSRSLSAERGPSQPGSAGDGDKGQPPPPHSPLHSQPPGPSAPTQPAAATSAISRPIQRPPAALVEASSPDSVIPQQRHQQPVYPSPMVSPPHQISRDTSTQIQPPQSSANEAHGKPAMLPQQDGAQAVLGQHQPPAMPMQGTGCYHPQATNLPPAQLPQRLQHLQQPVAHALQQQRQQQHHHHQQQPPQSHIQQHSAPYNFPHAHSPSNTDSRTPTLRLEPFQPIQDAFQNAMESTYGQVLAIVNKQREHCNQLAQALDHETQWKNRYAHEKEGITAKFREEADLHKLARDDRDKLKKELGFVKNKLNQVEAHLMSEQASRTTVEMRFKTASEHIDISRQEREDLEGRYREIEVKLGAKDAAHDAYRDIQKGLQERCEEEIRELKEKVEMLEKDAAVRTTMTREFTSSATQVPTTGVDSAEEQESIPPIVTIRTSGQPPSPDGQRLRGSSLASGQHIDELQEQSPPSSASVIHQTHSIPAHDAELKLLTKKVKILTKELARAKKRPQQSEQPAESSCRQAGMLGALKAMIARQNKKTDELKQEVERLKGENKALKESQSEETIKEEARRDLDREMDASFEKMIMSDDAVEGDSRDISENSHPGKEETLQQLHGLERELEVVRKEMEEVREGKRSEGDVHEQQRQVLETELEKARMDLYRVGEDMKQTRETLEHIREQKAQADDTHQRERKEVEVELEEAKTSLQEANEELEKLRKTVRDLQPMMVTLTEAKDRERQVAEESKQALQRELDVRQERCAKLANHLVKVQGEVTGLLSEVETIRKNAEAREAEMRDKVERDCLLWVKERKELSEKHETANADVKKRLSEAQQELATVRNKLETVEAERRRLRLEIGNTRDELRVARGDLKKETDKLNAEVSKVKAENKDLEDQLNQFTFTVREVLGSSPSASSRETVQPSPLRSLSGYILPISAIKAKSKHAQELPPPDQPSTKVVTPVSKDAPPKSPANKDKGKSKDFEEPPPSRPSTPDDISTKIAHIHRKPTMRMPPSELAKSRSADTELSSSSPVASTSRAPKIVLNRLNWGNLNSSLQNPFQTRRRISIAAAPGKSLAHVSSEAKEDNLKRKVNTDSPSSHRRRRLDAEEPDTTKESEPSPKKRRVS